MRAYNEDGRQFIRESMKKLKDWNEKVGQIEIKPKKNIGHRRKKIRLSDPSTIIPVPKIISHYVMNLPATAIEFLGMHHLKRC